MIDLLSTAQVLLKDAGYDVRLAEVQKSVVASFEDATIVGFCSLFETPAQLISKWRTQETEILTRFAPNFRSAGEKAWNVYCIFICAEPATEGEARQVSWIEEDLDRTRKIAGCGISTRDELVRHLLPVLPLQHQPELPETDVTRRLEARIADIAPQAQHIVLDPEILPLEVVTVLGRRT